MLNTITIKNFKSIKDLTITNFKAINIFIGKPNVGKTSILEAIYLYLYGNPEALLPILNSRGMLNEKEVFESLFYDYNISQDIVLKGDNNTINIKANRNNQSIKVIDELYSVNNVQFHSSNNASMTITKTNPNEFNIQISGKTKNKQESVEFIPNNPALKEKNLRDKLLKIMMIKEKREKIKEICQKFVQEQNNIDNIRIIGDQIMVEQQHLTRDINFKLMGSGFQAYMSIHSAILNNNKYILIDEIENGLHFENIKLLIKDIIDITANKIDMQFFITTHNQEILKNIYQILNDTNQQERTAFFNLYNKNGRLEFIKYSQEDFITNIENENELRC